MVWQPSFKPNRLPRDYPSVKKTRPPSSEVVEFTIGVESDKNVPDLTFLVNPAELTISMSHMSQPEAVRGGWMIEHAGPALDTMNVRGRSAGVLVGGVGLATACNGSYIQPSSEARQQIDQLVLLFKDNGSVRNPTYPYVIDSVGYAWVFYDNVFYIGRFDELTISETAESPYSVNFAFTFTIHEKVE